MMDVPVVLGSQQALEDFPQQETSAAAQMIADEANLMLNAFVISASKVTKDELDGIIKAPYRGGAEGLLTAGAIAGMTGGSNSNVGARALGGAVVGFLADTLITDDYYTFVLDVELRERPLDGDVISNSKASRTNKGFSSANSSSQTSARSSVQRGDNYQWVTYETRIVSTANKMNLDIEEAKPLVIEKAALTLSEFML